MSIVYVSTKYLERTLLSVVNKKHNSNLLCFSYSPQNTDPLRQTPTYSILS